MIDLDHHATTPLGAAARTAMREWLETDGGNPSSVHGLGRRARTRLEASRDAVAGAIGARPREVVFTSGGTEAVHLAVHGVGRSRDVRAVLVDPGAHPALRSACDALAAERGMPCAEIPSRPGGAFDMEALARLLAATPGTLVAYAWVQHETGAIAPVRAVADLANAAGGIAVVDAVQALGKIAIDVATSGVVAAAFSAHKIGGPTGIGAAWIAAGMPVSALLGGGAQERGLRAGTENVSGAIGMGAAAGGIRERLAAMEAVAQRRDRIERVLQAIDGVVLNANDRARVATACHVSVRGIAGEELVASLDIEGFCVSSGPACASGRPGASASMLRSYPDEPWRAAAALRVTLGPETTDADVDAFCSVLPRIVARVRV